jgi:hypothetical protein
MGLEGSLPVFWKPQSGVCTRMSDLSVRSRPAPAAHLAAAHRYSGQLTNSGRICKEW